MRHHLRVRKKLRKKLNVKMLQRGIIFVILVIIFSGCIEEENKNKEQEYEEPQIYSYSNISIKEVRASIDGDIVIVDVREPEEYANCRINKSILIPLEEIEKRHTELGAYKDNKIIVMCRSGSRSAEASEKLIELKFRNVNNMRGGIVAWYVAGYELAGECKGAPEFRMEDIMRKNDGWEFFVGKGCS